MSPLPDAKGFAVVVPTAAAHDAVGRERFGGRQATSVSSASRSDQRRSGLSGHVLLVAAIFAESCARTSLFGLAQLRSSRMPAFWIVPELRFSTIGLCTEAACGATPKQGRHGFRNSRTAALPGAR